MGRRLAAILAADLVGYGRIMSADDADTRRRLKTLPKDLTEAAISERRDICVARDAYNQVKNKIDFGFEPLGEPAVKNIRKPVAVYRLLVDRGPVPTAVALKRAGRRDRASSHVLRPTAPGHNPVQATWPAMIERRLGICRRRGSAPRPLTTTDRNGAHSRLDALSVADLCNGGVTESAIERRLL
jgi:hypothetical protein